jgi:Lar family restriction alleviation protein
MTDAKPCPFCGGKKLERFDYPFRRRPGTRGCYVKCAKCGSTSGKYETIEDAVNAWNQRKENSNE